MKDRWVSLYGEMEELKKGVYFIDVTSVDSIDRQERKDEMNRKVTQYYQRARGISECSVQWYTDEVKVSLRNHATS